jgi:hypothetical protein
MSQIGTASETILKSFFRLCRRFFRKCISTTAVVRFLFPMRNLVVPCGSTKVYPLVLWLGNQNLPGGVAALQRYDAVNTIGAKNTELSFVISAKINLATAALGGAGQRHLMNRAHSLAVFVFKQNNRLSCHRRRKTKVGKLNNLAAYRLLCGGEFRFGIHSTIEADAMYLLK